jgi:phospholipid-transporting ATPase
MGKTYLNVSERKEFIHKQERYLKKKFPKLYYIGQQKTIFTIPNFIFWYFQGLVHGIIVFFITMGCFNFEIMDIWGMPVGLSAFSLTIYTSIIFVFIP